jgi:hypothetical protein
MNAFLCASAPLRETKADSGKDQNPERKAAGTQRKAKKEEPQKAAGRLCAPFHDKPGRDR